MERKQVFEIVKESVVEILQVDPGDVHEATSFKDDFDADSLDLVELVMALEERFEITVPEDEVEHVTTVGGAVDLVLAKLGAGV